ncbi:MAG: hypothetical protein [Caudoviricetes sp.]|nr:MAG: hypothetical protein [Caudoviricetes sp.]
MRIHVLQYSYLVRLRVLSVPPSHSDIQKVLTRIKDHVATFPELVANDWFLNEDVLEVAGISDRTRSRAYLVLRKAGLLNDLKPKGINYQQLIYVLFYRHYWVERSEVVAVEKLIQLINLVKENG